MSLRLKILLLLGVIGLLPASITATLDSQRLRSLSANLTDRHSSALSEQTLRTMQRIADDYADVLDRESRRIRMLTTLQAAHATRLLNAAQAASYPDKKDLEHNAGSEASGQQPAPVARVVEGQSFHFPAAVEAPDVTTSIAALQGMDDFYVNVFDTGDSLVARHYVVLKNGLTASFPAHEQYPADFDARERPWYSTQEQSPRFRWFRPHFDLVSKALVINASTPLFDREGSFQGISAIDVDLSATFEMLQLPAYLQAGSELLQVVALSPPQVASERIVVLARQHAALAYEGWQVLPELESFSLGDRAINKLVFAAMFAQENGHLKVNIKGEESFVVFRRFGETASYLVMIVPLASATHAALEAKRYAAAATDTHIATVLKFLFAASTLVIIVALVASRHLTRPLEQLKHAVQRLAGGDLEARVELASRDELAALGGAFNSMVPQLKEHARVGEALSLAREVQQQLLPARAPQVSGYEIAGESLYSDQTGGDYFDYVPLESTLGERYGVVVADVSGHGIGPSLLMASTRASLHGGRGRGLSLGELLGFVNRQLALDVSRGHFVTLFLLAIESSHAELAWATAGHDPALLYRADSRTISELGGEDIPLGIDAEWQFGCTEGIALNDGDIIVMTTDGIWETAGANDERYGKQRIADYVCAHADASAESLCSGLRQEVETFRGARVQHDDMTIVVVKRTTGNLQTPAGAS
jgi:phosphoserine phosphatase RsbU/P